MFFRIRYIERTYTDWIGNKLYYKIEKSHRSRTKDLHNSFFLKPENRQGQKKTLQEKQTKFKKPLKSLILKAFLDLIKISLEFYKCFFSIV